MKEILKQVIHGKAQLHIGHLGISLQVIDQLKRQFKRKKLLKIKFLSLDEFDNIKDAANTLAKLSNSKVMDTRGKTCILLDRSNRSQ